MNVSVAEQLMAAKSAAEQLSQHRELERQAAMIPALETAARREAQQAQAGRTMEEQRQLSRAALAALKPRCRAWREKYADWLKLSDELVQELASIQAGLDAEAKDLLSARYQLLEAETQEPLMGYNDVNSAFKEDWDSLAGRDPELTTVDFRDCPRIARDLVQKTGRHRIYQPATGASQFFMTRW
jgi:hypothetical protein